MSIAGGDLIQGKNFGFKPGTSATISGFKWEDLDADGLWGGGESPLSGWTIYIDANENGDLDAGEVSTVTAGDGSYTFTGLTPGSYVIGEVTAGRLGADLSRFDHRQWLGRRISQRHKPNKRHACKRRQAAKYSHRAIALKSIPKMELPTYILRTPKRQKYSTSFLASCW